MTALYIRRVFEEASGLAVLASCSQEQKSLIKDDQEYSVYTYYLLEAIRGEADLTQKGFITVQDIHTYTTDRVKMWAWHNNGLQTPTLDAQMSGDIICVDMRAIGEQTMPIQTSKSGGSYTTEIPSTSDLRNKLYHIMEHYTKDLDLQEICLAVNIRYPRLAGNSHAERAFSLTTALYNEDRLADLEGELRKRLPNRFR